MVCSKEWMQPGRSPPFSFHHTSHTVVTAQDFSPSLPKHPVSLSRLCQLPVSPRVQIRDLPLKNKDYLFWALVSNWTLGRCFYPIVPGDFQTDLHLGASRKLQEIWLLLSQHRNWEIAWNVTWTLGFLHTLLADPDVQADLKTSNFIFGHSGTRTVAIPFWQQRTWGCISKLQGLLLTHISQVLQSDWVAGILSSRYGLPAKELVKNANSADPQNFLRITARSSDMCCSLELFLQPCQNLFEVKMMYS